MYCVPSPTLRTKSAVPPLIATLYDSANLPVGTHMLPSPADTLGGGEATNFEAELGDVPPQAVEVVVRFRQPRDLLPRHSESAAAEMQ